MKRKFINQMEPWIGREEKRAVSRYLSSGGWLTEFKETEKFEKMIARYCGVKHACVVSNGTVSLFTALMALDIGKGDEVIVPDLTMIASANAVLLAGAMPRLVDIDPKNMCLDLSLTEKAITKKTKAIMVVNLNGRSPNMDILIALCKKYNLYLIEDAAQAFGSKWKGKYMGTFGNIGSFSFSMPKIITTGQGGALITNDDELIKKIRKIKDFGRVKSGVDIHEMLGFNFKFTDLQAVIGIEQMKKLPARVQRRKEMYVLYKQELSQINDIKFLETDPSETTPWFIDVLAEDRDKLINFLKANGIGSRPFYPPIHTQAPYRGMKEYKNANFPLSQKLSALCLWLPSSLFLSDRQIKHVTGIIQKFYE